MNAPTLLPLVMAGLTRSVFRLPGRLQALLRVLLSHYVLNGLMVSLGLVLIMVALLELAGLQAASTAAVGILITSLPDVPSPRNRKIMQMLPAPLLGAPLFVLVQLVRGDPPMLGLVLCAGTFLAAMMMAWGQRGGPICYALLISMMLSMAAHPVQGMAALLQHGGWFLLGASAYLLWGVLVANLLNTRYRQQLLAECIATFAGILRIQAQRFGPRADHPALLAQLLARQAQLAQQLQSTRDVVLESPTRPQRLQQAAALMALLDARDQQLACDLELDNLLVQINNTPAQAEVLGSAHPANATVADAAAFTAIGQTLFATADQLHQLSLAMLLGQARRFDTRPALTWASTPTSASAVAQAKPAGADRLSLSNPSFDHLALAPSLPLLMRQSAGRAAFIQAEAGRIAGLLRGDAAPEIAAVRDQWQLFVSPTRWSIKPLLGQLAWRASTLRFALRLALAVGVGFAVALHLPWVAHEYWILLTIVVVMRTNLAQTVQRRNDRVTGTLLGCVLVLGLLWLEPGAATIFLVIALGLGISHAFVLRRYLFAATAATVGGLLQAHLLQVGISPVFAVSERIADTLLGAGLAWLFSYVLPVWERGQIPALVQQSLRAQLAHAQLALAWPDAAELSDMPWRLARREAYSSISELTLATQRTLAEPHTVQLALEPLQAMQTQSYRLLAQLTAIKSVLLHRERLDADVARQSLEATLVLVGQALGTGGVGKPAKPAATSATASNPSSFSNNEGPAEALHTTTAPIRSTLPDAADLTPWLLRRLQRASSMAEQLQQSALRSVGGV